MFRNIRPRAEPPRGTTDESLSPRTRHAFHTGAGPNIRRMFIVIVGAGRVGSSLARAMLKDGHEVSCLDEDPESQARLAVGLERSWEDAGGHFTVGTGLEIEALEAAGVERADAFVAATDGDNTNIVISQIAKRRFNVPMVIARVLDPLRAGWYEQQGLHTICPTRIAIDMLEAEVREGAKKLGKAPAGAGGDDAGGERG
jgi:trk system potassium uptake protein TrkA